MSLDTASDPEKRLTGAHMLVANVALLGGIVTGLLQGLEHAGVEFPASEYFLQSYYHSVSPALPRRRCRSSRLRRPRPRTGRPFSTGCARGRSRPWSFSSSPTGQPWRG